MSFAVIWTAPAVSKLRDLRAADPTSALAIARSVAALADDPEPTGSAQLGTTPFRRLRLGAHRVLYEVDEANFAIVIHNVGFVRPIGNTE